MIAASPPRFCKSCLNGAKKQVVSGSIVADFTKPDPHTHLRGKGDAADGYIRGAILDRPVCPGIADALDLNIARNALEEVMYMDERKSASENDFPSTSRHKH